MSETQNENTEDNFEAGIGNGHQVHVPEGDEQDPLEYSTQMGLEEEAEDDNGAAELLAFMNANPEAREVILPVIMRKGEELAALGDAVFDPTTNKMVVSFNTEAGRSIAEFIGSGFLAAISFVGHMARNEKTNSLN